ncbi:Lactose transport system permease protein LacF [Paenibacillus konkukensis]|uniref:Lactose transport system permease protein LacF n=1 Tax=Paenibacillus konkukensis TaxID=2020716 RepID=A0ABY4RKK8_9BACL|nr:sugar ABC transporter permease [Paenibacillus konkukensis]UQZ82680.1 Lactose transport system permease protein LacF [Paenibacillus konkukensis]
MNTSVAEWEKKTAANAATAAKKQRLRDKRWTIVMFIAPAFLVYLLYIIYPIYGTLYYSLFDWKGGPDKTFVGIANYTRLFIEPVFWSSLANNMKVVLSSVFLQIPLGLLMALLLFSAIRGLRFFQTIYFMPFLMSTVAIGMLWVFMFDPLSGAVNKLIGLFGFENIAWLSENKTAMAAILIVIVWQYAPFYMILFKAAIVGISEDLYEAAEIDGAGPWDRFSRITFPLLVPTIVTSSILAIVGSLKAFDIFFIMTGGGPGNATELLGIYMYKQAFIHFNMGFASAVAFTMFVLAFLAAGIIQYMEYARKKKEAL